MIVSNNPLETFLTLEYRKVLIPPTVEYLYFKQSGDQQTWFKISRGNLRYPGVNYSDTLTKVIVQEYCFKLKIAGSSQCPGFENSETLQLVLNFPMYLIFPTDLSFGYN